MTATSDLVLSVRGLSKIYPDGTKALSAIDLDVPRGQLVAVIGPSGAGKSTLMRCINRLVEPSSGEIVVNGRTVTGAGKRQLRSARREIGMVFQHFNLVERLPAVRNVLHGRLGYTSPLTSAFGVFPRREVERALGILAELGLADQALKRCADLSGGQKQRVGISRALMQDSALILADEPIASLDPWASESIMATLKQVAVEKGITTIVNLHQVEFAKEFADRIIGLHRGELYCDIPTAELDEATVRHLYYGDTVTPATQGGAG